MTTATKLKVSLTLSADLLALVDREAHKRKGTRSGTVEAWLRRASTEAAERELADATAQYYLSLQSDEQIEEEVLARGLSNAARRVSYDVESTLVKKKRRVKR